MAKESMKAREVKRAKCVERYAKKRAELKAAGDYEGLQKLPLNCVLHVSFEQPPAPTKHHTALPQIAQESPEQKIEAAVTKKITSGCPPGIVELT